MKRQRVAILGLLVYGMYLTGALLTSHVSSFPWPGFPWEAFVVFLPLSVYGLWRFVACRPFAELGFALREGWFRQVYVASLFAAGHAGLWLVVHYAAGWRTASAEEAPVWTVLIVVLLVAPLVGGVFNALPEEFVFRGFLLRVLTPTTGVVAAALISSTLFALGHLPRVLSNNALPNAEAAGAGLALTLLHLMGFGLLMAWTVWKTGALWFAIGWHFGGNYPGVIDQFLAGSQLEGPLWLARHTGYGAELLALAALATEACILLLLLPRFLRMSRRVWPLGSP